VTVVPTAAALHFVGAPTWSALSGKPVSTDVWSNVHEVPHVRIGQTADLVVVAPATADLLAKAAHGLADDLLGNTLLTARCPVVFAPAMHTEMWHHPATQRNLQQLRADGVFVIEPDEGEMACGTIGPGRLSEPERIVAAALDILENSRKERARDFAGEHVLITVGATREAIDPVRFLSNNSSGRMGFAIADAAKQRGAEVTLIAGVTNTPPPRNVEIICVNSAAEMHVAVMGDLAKASIFIGAAAVADYRPVKRSPEKIKKTESSLSLELERTPDILREVAAANQDGLLVIGFAAETENVLQNAREKLSTKNLDAIVANDVSQNGVGFDSVNNEVTIISRDRNAPIHVPLMAKTSVADIILDEVVRLRARVKPSTQSVMKGPRKA